MNQISELAQNIVPSMTVELKGLVIELCRQGKDIVSMTSGEPDMNTPEHIRAAAKRAIDEGKIKYSPVPGIMPLREAITKKLHDDFSLSYKAVQTCVSTGAKQALFNAIMVLCNPNEEVLLPTPCWVSYTEQIKMARAVPVFVPLDESDGYQIDVDKIEKCITDRTKMIIINNPNNPTGAVYTKQWLQALAALVEKYGIWVISDEIYEKLIYDEAPRFTSFPTLSSYALEHTVLINGWSKAYAMTGWRIGYAAGPAHVIKAMASIQGHVTYGANAIAQYAALEALTGPQESVEQMKQEFDQRRQYLYGRLNAIEGLSYNTVQGTFYLLPNVSNFLGIRYNGRMIQNSFDLCTYLIEEAGVAFVPGDSFYAPGTIRMSYACSLDDIKESMDRLERGLSLLKTKGENMV